MWDLIVSVPDHCLSFYFAYQSLPVHSFNAVIIPILRGCLQSLFNIVRHPGDLRVSVATRFSVESSSLFHHSIYL